jgi:hypothetical protein
MLDPSHDLEFQGLKREAKSGTDSGPEFDAGVLSVIEQIEQTGSFVPDDSLYDPLTLKPSAERQDEYSNGVRFAQTALRRYQRIADAEGGAT